ncbi:MAG: hypothetical protein KKG60_03495 [Nanoarchaeota archaeon]|nr:hypothetical protein [Nanoarchaeota archaeon]
MTPLILDPCNPCKEYIKEIMDNLNYIAEGNREGYDILLEKTREIISITDSLKNEKSALEQVCNECKLPGISIYSTNTIRDINKILTKEREHYAMEILDKKRASIGYVIGVEILEKLREHNKKVFEIRLEHSRTSLIENISSLLTRDKCS